MMNLMEAINVRSSRRTYLETPIAKDKEKKLTDMINLVNEQGNLCMKLIQNEPTAFGKLSKSYGMFKGVKNYILLIGKTEPNVK
ncbi:MAG: Nitroreductase family protein, partial [Herbinix sp.]|nr:Nitroreductase family protein [Herbinix sp.]